MKMAQLHLFHAVASHESYSRAAAHLYLSQPHVYVQIRELERQLRCQLFEQVGKRAVLTEAGKLLMAYATQMLKLEEEAAQALDELRGLQRGQLSLVAGITVANYLVPPAIATFKERFPGIDVDLHVLAPTAEVEEAALRFQIDLLLGPRHRIPNSVHEEIWHTDLVLCVGANHRLSECPQVTINDLSAEVFVWVGPVARRRLGHHAVARLGLEPEQTILIDNPETAKRVAMANYGVVLLPRPVVAEEIKTGRLRELSIPTFNAPFNFYCIRHEARKLSPAAAAFLEIVRESASSDQVIGLTAKLALHRGD